MQSFLLFGGDSRLAEAFNNLYPEKIEKLSRKECDITKIDQVKAALSSFKGRYVINCAAVTDIEDCEENPKKCFIVNTLAPKKVEGVCTKQNKKLIQISSDYALFPENNYAASKFILEQILNKKTLVVRTNFYDNKNHAVKNIINDNKAKYYKNMYINPVSVNRLVKEICKNKKSQGLLNIFSRKMVSYYKLAHQICSTFNKNCDKLIEETVFKNTKDKTKRPLTSVVDSDIKIDLKKDLLDFKNYIEKYYEYQKKR